MILHAYSTNNGITFYSEKLPIVGVEIYYDDSGYVQTQRVFTKPAEFIHSLNLSKDYKHFHVSNSSVTIFILTILVFSFFAFEVSQNFGFIIAGIYFCCFCAYEFLKLLKTVIYNKKSNVGCFSTAKFHGAEHMSIQAYNELNRLPTLEEVKKFSRFDKYCGSQTALSYIFITWIGCFLIILLTHIGMYYDKITLLISTALSIILLILITIFDKNLTFLQVFTTSKPTDKELYLALEGIRQFILMEEFLEDVELVESLKKLSDYFNTIVDKESKEIFGKK